MMLGITKRNFRHLTLPQLRW